MSKTKLIEIAKANLEHARAGTIDQTDSIYRVPAENYFNKDRWQLEMKQIFRRLPLMMATTAELPETGDWKAMTAANVPILLSRTKTGQVKAFYNMCSHRGAQIMAEGRGNTHRFTCPYHAWSYNTEGQLTSIYSNKEFGELDKQCHNLTELPCLEKAGLIWVILNRDSSLSIEDFLCNYDEMLAHFDFANWHYFDHQTIKGPNWKIAYDGYLDLYHLPILHKDTFGPDYPSKANYYNWGPHQRVAGPDSALAQFEQLDDAQWPVNYLLNGVWTIFPHISIASFDGGGRSIMLSQLFPGETPSTSYTVQHYLMENTPTEEQAEAAKAQFEFLKYVVEQEDYATGIKQQLALESGGKEHVMFGRNEGGGQRFHDWVERLISTPDKDLHGLFPKTD
jgi:phenylpropionate dioxygenase-like ring-hydroxylating dioxygenase large terminal subunit